MQVTPLFKQYQQLSNAGYRTLGVAYKPADTAHNFTRDDEKGMIFLGFIALFDPPKANVAATIDKVEQPWRKA